MAYESIEKLSLALRLLVGMKHPFVRKALEPHGFGPETLDEGWRLLVTAGRQDGEAELEEEPPPLPSDAELIAFQRRWFPVARIVLGARGGPAAPGLVRSLRRRRGLGASLAVSRFIASVEGLKESPVPEEREAREILRERGLTDEVLQNAGELVERARRVVAVPVRSISSIDGRALAELWAWCREWQGLVRRSITNKNHLRALGLVKFSSGSSDAKARAAAVSVGERGPERERSFRATGIGRDREDLRGERCARQ